MKTEIETRLQQLVALVTNINALLKQVGKAQPPSRVEQHLSKEVEGLKQVVEGLLVRECNAFMGRSDAIPEAVREQIEHLKRLLFNAVKERDQAVKHLADAVKERDELSRLLDARANFQKIHLEQRDIYLRQRDKARADASHWKKLLELNCPGIHKTPPIFPGGAARPGGLERELERQSGIAYLAWREHPDVRLECAVIGEREPREEPKWEKMGNCLPFWGANYWYRIAPDACVDSGFKDWCLKAGPKAFTEAKD